MEYVYELESENLTHLNGSIYERTYVNWRKLFADKKAAKKYAEANYDGDKEIKWIKESKDYTRSQDLGNVMYNITRKEVN